MHSKHEYVRADVHTNTVESAWSLLKRSIVGSYHQLSTKHLPRYLDEVHQLYVPGRVFSWGDLGNDAASRRYGERALAIRRKAFGEESLDVARSLLGLGRTALLAGRLAEANDLLDRALATQKK